MRDKDLSRQTWRYELKLTGSYQYLAAARSWILMHSESFRTAYPKRRVNNLYFDTQDLGNFNENLSGTSTRQKLRLRWYGDSYLTKMRIESPILELKYKQNQLGGKRRVQIDRIVDLNKSYKEIIGLLHDSLSDEGKRWLRLIDRPSLINHYDREYFVTPDGMVRATLDYNQGAADQVYCAHPNLIRTLLVPDDFVIEVKADPAYIDRIESIMNEFPLQRSRNSKYVNNLGATFL